MNHGMSRRDFIRNTALFSALGVAPQFLTRTVEGATTNPIAGFKDDRVLVVVQLAGGNDGLNTLVPHGDDAYYRARPKIGLKKDRILRINDDLAFNNRCADLMDLYDDGRLAVLQGVGYPNPDRSHFRSMEIWQTASDSDRYASHGWIGRYFDHQCSGSARPHVGIALDKERPQAFDSNSGLGVAFENPRNFGWEPGSGADSAENFAKLNAPTKGAGDNLDFLRHVTSNAIMSSKEIHEAADRAKLRLNSPRAIDRALDTVAALIRADLDTRIYYVSATGFDTHANQLGQQDNLLQQVATGLKRFQDRLQSDRTSERVVTMVFSEFGRRVQENSSGGTDHGTAAPMFFMGDAVKPGIHGATPSLSDLDQGDLKHTVDFRSAYATVLQNWFEVDAADILGAKFPTLGIV